MHHELKVLRSAWEKTRRASGGRWAMAGFDYQLSLVVDELIRRVDSDPDSRVLVEAISDILTTCTEALVVTQVKRTLDGSTLRAALDEFWAINDLAKDKTPELATRLAFVVHAKISLRTNYEAAIARWNPRARQVAPERIAAFRARITVRATHDPRLEAVRKLIEIYQAEDPFGEVDSFVGKLVAAAETGSFDRAILEIRTKLAALKARIVERYAEIHIWSARDWPPTHVKLEEDTSKAVRVGERLNVMDLREGRIAARTAYDPLFADCDIFLGAVEAQVDKIPVFWLEGRSGSGKSAALLHLAARLHFEDPSRLMIWLGPYARALERTASIFNRELVSGRSIIFLLDDPYGADPDSFKRGVEHLHTMWQRARELDGATERPPGVPVLLCCSPGEQASEAERACVDTLHVRRALLPHETQNDLDELAEWYRARTGKDPPPTAPDSLLVQRFFEWRRGALPDFAERFRRRIQALDGSDDGPTYNAIASILAMQRLYVDYPIGALNTITRSYPQAEKAFIRLAEEEHHFVFTPDGNGFVRLTHPHLADAIYRQWFGRRDERPLRRKHLATGLCAYLDFSEIEPGRRFAPLWAISRLAAGRASNDLEEAQILRSRLEFIQQELEDVLTTFHRNIAATSLSPLTDLPVWANLEDELELTLTDPPLPRLAEAIRHANTPARGLRLACHLLLRHHKRFSEGISTVKELLDRAAGWQKSGRVWPDWWPLATDFSSRFGPQTILVPIARVASVFPADEYLIRFLHQQLLPNADNPALREILFAWLEAAPMELAAWAPILDSLYNKVGMGEPFERVALRYLSEQPGNANWGFFWGYLWKDGVVDPTELVVIGSEWLRVQISNPGWSHVWEALWKYLGAIESQRAGLEELAIRWLSDIGESDHGWSFVWEALWENPRTTEPTVLRIAELAVDWLSDAGTTSPSWQYIWHNLMSALKEHAPRAPQVVTAFRVPDDRGDSWGPKSSLDPTEASRPWSNEALLGRVIAWHSVLSATHPQWGTIWRDLWKRATTSNQRERLKSQGIAWLSAIDPSQNRWSFPFRIIVGTNSDDEFRAKLMTRVITWLTVASDDLSWSDVWVSVWRATQKIDRQIYRIGRRWLLYTSNSTAQWLRVWLALGRANDQAKWLGCGATDPIWRALGRRAIRKLSVDHQTGRSVFIELVHAGTNLTKYHQSVMIWLANNPTHMDWPLLFHALWSNSNEDDRRYWAAGGVVWLRRTSWRSVERQSWCLVAVDCLTPATLLEYPHLHNAISDIIWLMPSYANLFRELIRDIAPQRTPQVSRAIVHKPVEAVAPWMWRDHWRAQWDSAISDPRLRANLTEEAKAWLIKYDLKQRGWTSVWKELWRVSDGNHTERATLATVADQWLERVSPNDEKANIVVGPMGGALWVQASGYCVHFHIIGRQGLLKISL